MDTTSDHPTDTPSWVALGTVGRNGRAAIDRRATITVEGSSWSLDWWVGAEDRWHRNRDDGVVRQRAEDWTPVITSGLRLPGGELEQRAWAVADPARTGGGSSLVVEFHNATPVAVALALSVRAADGCKVRAIDLDARTVSVDGATAFVWSREPSRIASSSGDEASTFDVVVGDRAGSTWPEGGVRDERGAASAAFVFPLPHTATLRIVVPLPDVETFADGAAHVVASDPASPIDTTSVPEATQVVAGWVAMSARAPRYELPERQLEELTALAQRHLLVHAAGLDPLRWPGVPVDGVDRAELCIALDSAGFHSESARLLLAAIDLQRVDGSFDDERLDATAGWLVALGRHAALSGDLELAGEAVGRIGAAAHWLWRRASGRRLRPSTRFFGIGAGPAHLDEAARRAHDARWTARAFRAAVDLLGAVDQRDGALLIERHAIDLALMMGSHEVTLDGPGSDLAPNDATPIVRELLVEGAPLATWASALDGHDPARTAAYLRLVRALVVDDADGAIAMVPHLDAEWYGSPFAVHDLPTSLGRLSYAVRWHGTRAALLWDLQARDGVEVELRAPGLDPAWSTREPRGEALLGGMEIPSTVELHVHLDEHEHTGEHDHDHDHDHDHANDDGDGGSVAPPPERLGGSFS